MNKNTIPWMLKKKAKKIKLNKIKFVFCISHSHNSPVLQLTEKLTNKIKILFLLALEKTISIKNTYNLLL